MFRPTFLEDTRLWNHLNSAAQAGGAGSAESVVAGNLIQICGEAMDRMKMFPSLHPQYTLHDETHLLRVTELMGLMIPDQVLQNELNVVEIALLILSAFFHDQGMVLERGEIDALSSDATFRVFERDWEIEHPNLKEARQRLHEQDLSEEEYLQCRRVEEDLEGALLTDFIRRTHGRRSHDYVLSHYGSDPRWIVGGTNLARLVAMLCESHYRPTSDLTPENGFHHDESVGTYRINMPYLALLLRLADVLDFDRERTPETLYRTIHFTNEVSLGEWEKHRSVDGWVISPELVRFTVRCEHPAYERAVRDFMDNIDSELSAAHTMVRTFPAGASTYYLDLPTSVDRSRIGAKDEAYIYHDLEFSLSRDEVIKLLMMDALYQSPALCVRELMQNSLDALRHLEALFKRDTGNEWGFGNVTLEHFVDDHGYEVLRCADNGVGMDEDVIEQFLTNAGRSYYRSPEFDQERASFSAAGVDFDPCAQFGIGFMSCFMLGDRIVIRTRRHNGPNRGLGKPLIVEINGLGGIVLIRKGALDQPAGTTIEITGRKKPKFVEERFDQVQLVAVIDGYALACEFPIEGKCSVPGIEKSISVPPTPVVRQTSLELTALKRHVTLEQGFSDVDTRMSGQVRASFLIDEDGRPCVANEEAAWEIQTGTTPKTYLKVRTGEGVPRGDRYDHGQTCLDGILVCGEPGRDPLERSWYLGHRSNLIHLGRDYFLLDVRGELKPSLTPARVPPDRFVDLDASWEKVQTKASLAHGRLWKQVAQRLQGSADGSIFWQLVAIHGFTVPWMPAEAIWAHVRAPVLHENGNVSWRSLSSTGTFRAVKDNDAEGDVNGDAFDLITEDGERIEMPEEVTRWPQRGDAPKWLLYQTLLTMSAVSIEDNTARLTLKQPRYTDRAPWESRLHSRFDYTATVTYEGALSDALSAQLPFTSVNRDHPLVQAAIAAQDYDDPSEFQIFCTGASYCLSNSETLEALSKSDDLVTHQMQWAGRRSLNVDWAQVPLELQPPYAVWLERRGQVEIHLEDFERWASTDPAD